MTRLAAATLNSEYVRDIFLWLERDTIPEIRDVFNWALEHALLSEVSFLDGSSFARKTTTDITVDELLKHINSGTKKYFRIIVRRNFNWFLLLSDKGHIEDLIEIGLGAYMLVKGHILSIATSIKSGWAN